MLREKDIIEVLRNDPGLLPSLTIEVVDGQPAGAAESLRGPDTLVDVRWSERTYRFVATLKAQATPRLFRPAIE
ncbi:MAG: hypothetical protein V3T70_05690, partial [Phycisphaerae bacterium]